MNIPRLGPISDGLIYKADIPLGWQFISSIPPIHELLKIQDSNRQVLQLLLKESTAQELEAISDPVVREMHRLESKLDLLINLVGNLLFNESGFPERHKVWLGSEGLQVIFHSSSEELAELAGVPVVSSDDYNRSGSSSDECLIKINLFLDGHIPQPLYLFARIFIVQYADADCLMMATFQSLDQEVQDLLEKFIFQQHRRVIASNRTEYFEH